MPDKKPGIRKKNKGWRSASYRYGPSMAKPQLSAEALAQFAKEIQEARIREELEETDELIEKFFFGSDND